MLQTVAPLPQDDWNVPEMIHPGNYFIFRIFAFVQIYSWNIKEMSLKNKHYVMLILVSVKKKPNMYKSDGLYSWLCHVKSWILSNGYSH